MDTVQKKILIVEDERDYAHMVKLRLELEGFSCAVAEDTQQGVYEMQNRPYDAMVLDLMLPGGGGFALLRELEKDAGRKQVPVVVLTGTSITPEIKAMIAVHNISALFTKPYDPGAFLTTLRELIEKTHERSTDHGTQNDQTGIDC